MQQKEEQYKDRGNYIRITDDHLYSNWTGIKDKCFNKKAVSYPAYGGRGITMQKDWIYDFPKFRDYLRSLPKYSPKKLDENGQKLSLDRTNNDGNYEEGNLRWATSSQQNSNKRKPFRANFSAPYFRKRQIEDFDQNGIFHKKLVKLLLENSEIIKKEKLKKDRVELRAIYDAYRILNIITPQSDNHKYKEPKRKPRALKVPAEKLIEG